MDVFLNVLAGPTTTRIECAALLLVGCGLGFSHSEAVGIAKPIRIALPMTIGLCAVTFVLQCLGFGR